MHHARPPDDFQHGALILAIDHTCLRLIKEIFVIKDAFIHGTSDSDRLIYFERDQNNINEYYHRECSKYTMLSNSFIYRSLK